MEERKSAVEHLKEAIYSRVSSPKIDTEARSPLSQPYEKVAQTWDKRDIKPPQISDNRNVHGILIPPPPPPPNPLMPYMSSSSSKPPRKSSNHRVFLLSAILFFLIALVVVVWTGIGGNNTISSQNIDLSVVAPALVDSGKNTTVQYIIANRTQIPLSAVSIVIDYPSGTRNSADPTLAMEHNEISVGDLAAGAQIQKTSSVVFFGAEGAQEKVHTTLQYQIAGSNAIFTKEADAMVVVGSAPISLSVGAPTEVIAGQQFDTTLTIVANSTNPIADVAVETQYPFGFSVQNTNPQASAGNTMWRLGKLNPGESKVIHITGTLAGEEGDTRVFHFLSGSESDLTNIHIAVPVISEPYSMTVRRPFVSGTIAINGHTGSAISAPLGSSAQVSIQWKNNLNSAISNVKFILSLSGAVDPSSVQASNGFYDSSKNQIVWSTQDNPALSTVAPGAEGTLQFSFTPISPSSQLLTNPNATLNFSVSALRSDIQGAAPQEVVSAALANVHFSSAATLSSKALYFSGPFRNTGPVPPVAGQQTTYSVEWSVSNSSNSLANARVSAALPQNVYFISGGAGGTDISYEESTRTVTWNIGSLNAGVGYGSPQRTGAFQVAITPSASQRGGSAQLTGSARLTGNDRYSQTTVSADSPSLLTVLDQDSGFSRGMETVK